MTEFEIETLPEKNKYVTEDVMRAFFSTSLNSFSGIFRDKVGRSSLTDGSTIGGRDVATVAAAINAAGNLVNDVINAKLDTSAKTILGEFIFSGSGALAMNTDANNGLWLSPTGILAKKLGATTFAIGIDGSPTFVGTITASAGSIGGWSLSATAIYFDGATDALSAGMATADYPFYAGKKYVDRATAPFRVTQAGVLTATGASISGTLTATAGTIGGFTLSSTALYAGTAATRVQLDTTSGIHLGATAFADAPFRVSLAGALTATSATITGALTAAAGSSIGVSYLSGTIAQANLNIVNMGWTQTSVFSSTDLDTVSWGAGTFTTAGGTSYSIGAGNTGNMSARTYIYLDIAVSTTAYQTTTTAATAVGAGKVLVATAINGADEATFQVFNGVGGLNISGADIALLSITSGELAASSVTTAKIAALAVTSGELAANAVTSAKMNLAARGWVQTSVFSVTDLDTVAWGIGTLTASDGTTYSIAAGNTGNMAAKTYIYLDIAVSTTAYQTTTTSGTAIGDGKILVAIAQNGAAEASFMLMNDNSYNIDAANIVSGSITANEIAASTITGAKIAATTITAANIAALTITAAEIAAGTITGAKIAATTITASNIAANTITASEIAAGTITTTQIAANTIVAGNIVAGTITGTQIAASTITSGLISVSQLSAISADMGAITAGTITVVSGGNTVALTPGSSTAIASGPTGAPTVTITQAGILTAVGGVFLKSYTTGENITAGNVLCVKPAYTDYYASADSYISSSFPTTKYGTADPIFIDNGANTRKALIKFDTSLWVSAERIVKAELILTSSGAWGTSLGLTQITGAWVEEDVTWNTEPASGVDFASPNIYGIAGKITGAATMTFDITQLARQWKSGNLTNNGLNISANGSFTIYSRENGTDSNRPTIRIYDSSLSNGYVYKADEDDYLLCRSIIGIANETKNSGLAIKVHNSGSVAISGNIGESIFLSGTAGAVTNNAVNLTRNIRLGFNDTATTAIFSPDRKGVYIETQSSSGFAANTSAIKFYVPGEATRVDLEFVGSGAAEGVKFSAERGRTTKYHVSNYTGDRNIIVTWGDYYFQVDTDGGESFTLRNYYVYT